MKALTLLLTVALAGLARAADDAPLRAVLARLPVREVTVFKDGHAFVLHRGRMPADADGSVLLDYLPAPVLGTFWPHAADNNVTLTAAVAGQRRVTVERTALNLRALIEANPGPDVLVTETAAGRETPPAIYPAIIIGLTLRGVQELEGTAPANTTGLLPQRGDVVLLKTAAGTKAVPIERIQDVVYKDQYKLRRGTEEYRNLLVELAQRRRPYHLEAGASARPSRRAALPVAVFLAVEPARLV